MCTGYRRRCHFSKGGGARRASERRLPKLNHKISETSDSCDSSPGVENEICDKIVTSDILTRGRFALYITPSFPLKAGTLLLLPGLLAMAFNNYSTLFKSGLLTDDSMPARYRSEPWAKEYLGPRRGSAPGSIVESVATTPLPSASVAETNASIASGESFYFTFKRRKNPSVYRSFLSLDLAESQSLRSASIRAKESIDGISPRAAASFLGANVYPSYVAYQILPKSISNIRPSFAAVYSPPPPSSPPASPTSLHSVPDYERTDNPFGVTFSPTNRRTVFLHSPVPRRPISIGLSSKRSVSPMRFASPPPSPPLVPHFDDPVSPTTTTTSSSIFLSRASTVSSGYRRAQRVDALKRLEGRGADGAVGRLVPRLSQNFMSMSDDEDDGIEEEDEDELSMNTDISVVIDQAMEEPEPAWDLTPGPSGSRKAPTQLTVKTSPTSTSTSRPRSRTAERGLTVTIDSVQWYSSTPRASSWMFYGDDDAGAAEDEEAAIEKGMPLDMAMSMTDLPSMSRSHSDGSNPRSSKRSRHSSSTNSIDSRTDAYLRPTKPTTSKNPKPVSHPKAAAQNLHPLSNVSSYSSLSASHTPPNNGSSSPSRSRSTPRSRSTRTSISESHPPSTGASRSVSTHSQSRSRQPAPAPQLELRLDWLATPPAEYPNFIDLRDETFETESRSDSWRSIFEVSCSA